MARILTFCPECKEEVEFLINPEFYGSVTDGFSLKKDFKEVVKCDCCGVSIEIEYTLALCLDIKSKSV